MPRSGARPALMTQRLRYQCAPWASRSEILPLGSCRVWDHGDHWRMGGTAGWIQAIGSSSAILIRMPRAAPGRARPAADPRRSWLAFHRRAAPVLVFGLAASVVGPPAQAEAVTMIRTRAPRLHRSRASSLDWTVFAGDCGARDCGKGRAAGPMAHPLQGGIIGASHGDHGRSVGCVISRCGSGRLPAMGTTSPWS